MTWRNRLIGAAYNGQPFFVEAYSATGGRLTDVGEDDITPEPIAAHDFGRAREHYGVEALLIGADYDKARDLLLTELRAGGVGTLAHPHLGTLQVVVAKWTLEESAEEGGLARISITFAEAGEGAPLETDSAAGLAAAQGAANQAAEAGFLAAQGATSNAAQGGFLGQAQGFGGNLARGATAFQNQANAVVGQVVSGVQAFTEPLATLARTPANLAAAVLGGVDAIIASAANAQSAFALLLQVIARLLGDTPQGDSPQVKAQRACQSLLLVGAVGELANQASQADWGNNQAASTAQTTLLGRMEGVLASTGDAQTYQALRNLQARAVQSLAQASTGLPQVKTIVLDAAVPWLALGQRLYPDDPDVPARADEVWQRNIRRAPNPLFMPGGVPLEYVDGA